MKQIQLKIAIATASHFIFLDDILFIISPVSTDGDVHGRLPAVPAEHLRRHPVPAVDLGGGNRRGAAGPLHCLHMLLLCEYAHTRTMKQTPFSIYLY